MSREKWPNEKNVNNTNSGNNGQHTINQTEEWNHKFSKLLNQSHPTIWLIIKKNDSN